jgi:hypothetical protein
MKRRRPGHAQRHLHRGLETGHHQPVKTEAKVACCGTSFPWARLLGGLGQGSLILGAVKGAVQRPGPDQLAAPAALGLDGPVGTPLPDRLGTLPDRYGGHVHVGQAPRSGPGALQLDGQAAKLSPGRPALGGNPAGDQRVQLPSVTTGSPMPPTIPAQFSRDADCHLARDDGFAMTKTASPLVGTTAIAARHYGVTPQTIRNWLRAGVLRGRMVGDRLLVDMATPPRQQERKP